MTQQGCNEPKSFGSVIFGQVESSSESMNIVVWWSLWLCFCCTLTALLYGLLAITGTTTHSGWTNKNTLHQRKVQKVDRKIVYIDGTGWLSDHLIFYIHWQNIQSCFNFSSLSLDKTSGVHIFFTEHWTKIILLLLHWHTYYWFIILMY